MLCLGIGLTAIYHSKKKLPVTIKSTGNYQYLFFYFSFL